MRVVSQPTGPFHDIAEPLVSLLERITPREFYLSRDDDESAWRPVRAAQDEHVVVRLQRDLTGSIAVRRRAIEQIRRVEPYSRRLRRRAGRAVLGQSRDLGFTQERALVQSACEQHK